jgi:hypothetical protein
VIPETRRIEISDGDWLLVRKRLTHGETTEAVKRRFFTGADGVPRIDPIAMQHAQVIAYLVDWSLTSPDGDKIEIRGESADYVEAALNSFDDETVTEILTAIRDHETAMIAARTEEKKTIPSGASESFPISSSPVPAGGGTSGSVN